MRGAVGIIMSHPMRSYRYVWYAHIVGQVPGVVPGLQGQILQTGPARNRHRPPACRECPTPQRDRSANQQKLITQQQSTGKKLRTGGRLPQTPGGNEGGRKSGWPGPGPCWQLGSHC